MGAGVSKYPYKELINTTIQSVSIEKPQYDTIDYESCFCTPGKITLETSCGETIICFFGESSRNSPLRGSIVDCEGKLQDPICLKGFQIVGIEKQANKPTKKCGFCTKQNVSYRIINDNGESYVLYVDDFCVKKTQNKLKR